MDGEKVQLDERVAKTDAAYLSWSSKKYDQWETMHDGVLWFDTAGCLSGSKIGDVNAAVVSSTSPRWKKWDRACTESQTNSNRKDCAVYRDQEDTDPFWNDNVLNPLAEGVTRRGYVNPGSHPSTWWTSSSDPQGYEFNNEVDEQVIVHTYTETVGAETRIRDAPAISDYVSADDRNVRNAKMLGGQYGTDIGVGGSMDWRDEDLYRDLLKDYIDLIEDCDVDCQAKGSQLTVVATLMGLAYGLAGLNAIFMFVGAWRYRWRFCSLICTAVVCLLQFVLLIVSGALLFTKYNAVCARSMVQTYGENMIWTMADDFYMTFSLWIVGFFAMFGFCCCGLCSAVRAK